MPYVYASFLRPVSAAPVAMLLLMAATLAGCDDPAKAQEEQRAQPKPKVTVVALKQESVSIDTILPGRVTAYQVAEVRPQVSGVLRKRLFREGENVTAGRQLYQIDPASYQAALSSAQAQLAKADAAVSSARVTVNRYKPLVAARAVSAIDYDNAVATQKQAEADVALARAAIDNARINLEYTKVLSPISGRTGRSATVGSLVTGDQAASLVTITQLDPIYVDVTQPSATLLRLRRELDAGRLTRSNGNAAEVKLILEDGTPYAHAGKLQFSEVTVDPGTGSVTLRAEFPNPDGVLMPGMFVRERIQEGVSPNALLVPQQAITRNYRGDPTTLVLGADGTVQERVVKTDRAIGNKWLVTDGLKAGDKVVVEGLQNVKSGATPDVTEIGLGELEKRTTTAPRPAQS